nr:hypothetical protein [Tanacetum cinerariifolium]
MSMGRVFKTRLRRWGVKLIREISTEFAIINEYSVRVNKMKVVVWPAVDGDEGDGGGDDNDDIYGGAGEVRIELKCAKLTKNQTIYTQDQKPQRKARSESKVDSTTHPHVVTVTSQKINVPVPPSIGVDCCPIARGSQPMSHVKPNRISPMSHVKPNRISPAKGDTKPPIDDKPRKNKSHLRTSTRIDSSSGLKCTVINSHSDSVFQTCAKCVTPSNHDLCVATCLQSAMATPSLHYNCSVERKVKQVWKPKHFRQVWKPTGKVLTTIGHQWRPTGRIFDLGNQCPLTKFTPPKVVSSTQHTRRTSPCANQRNPTKIGDPTFQTFHLCLALNAGRTDRPLICGSRLLKIHERE